MPGAVGMAPVNPLHPDLQTLIDKGADIGLFVGAARAALDKQKGFAYALGMVKGQLRDAAALADNAMAAPRPLAAGPRLPPHPEPGPGRTPQSQHGRPDWPRQKESPR